MTARTRALALVAATALLITACSSSSDKSMSVASLLSQGAAASTDSTGSAGDSASGSSSGTGAGTNPANVDVCALLSQADANEVARKHGLDGAQTASTTYTLTATKQINTGINPTSSCKFTITDGSAQGTVAFQVESASGFSVYSSGKKISGLGDEAYDGGGDPVVRVGKLMISPGEDSFTDEFTTDLLRKMVPHLK